MVSGTPNIINETTVDGNHAAMQIEYSFKGANNQRHGLEVWTIDRDIGYDFTYTTNRAQHSLIIFLRFERCSTLLSLFHFPN